MNARRAVSSRGLPAICLAMMLMIPQIAQAQEPRPVVKARAPSAALAALESGDPAVVSVIAAAFRENYSEYTDAERNALLDGVEAIAAGRVEGPNVSPHRSRRAAFSILAILALDSLITAPERNEVPARLMRIFETGEPLESRLLAVLNLGDVLSREPAESATILELLTFISTSPGAVRGVPPAVAVEALLAAGPIAVPTLRELHETGAIRDPQTRVWLSKLAERGFSTGRGG